MMCGVAFVLKNLPVLVSQGLSKSIYQRGGKFSQE